jgi:hypothetical protein
VAGIEAGQRRLRDVVLGEDAVADGLLEDELDGDRPVGRAHVEQDLPLVVGELAGDPALAGLRLEGLGVSVFRGVVPALQRLRAVGP